MAHRNAESKPKQWEWDDQRAIHIRMRHENVKKMYYKLLYRERTALPPPGAKRNHAQAHAANSDRARADIRSYPASWDNRLTASPSLPSCRPNANRGSPYGKFFLFLYGIEVKETLRFAYGERHAADSFIIGIIGCGEPMSREIARHCVEKSEYSAIQLSGTLSAHGRIT